MRQNDGTFPATCVYMHVLIRKISIQYSTCTVCTCLIKLESMCMYVKPQGTETMYNCIVLWGERERGSVLASTSHAYCMPSQSAASNFLCWFVHLRLPLEHRLHLMCSAARNQHTHAAGLLRFLAFNLVTRDISTHRLPSLG